MSYCINCGQKLEESFEFCPNCGIIIKINKTNYSKNECVHYGKCGKNRELNLNGIRLFNTISITFLILCSFFNWLSFYSILNEQLSFNLYDIANISRYKDITSILVSFSDEWNIILSISFVYYFVPIISIIILLLYLQKIKVKKLFAVYDILISFPIIITALIKFTLSSKGIRVEFGSGFYIFLIISTVLSITLNLNKN